MSLASLLARPEALPLLLLAPAAWLLLLALDRARARRLHRLTGLRAQVLGAERGAGRRAVRRALFAGGLLAALLAALHPTWGDDVLAIEAGGIDVVVCLDVSRSMLARDVAPDRLGRARADVGALARHVRGDRLGLVAFAGEARLVVPLTRDVASFAGLLALTDPLSVRRGGTDLGAALETALVALGERGGASPMVLLVSDGEDLGGRGLAVARTLRERGVVVHCVGVGTALGGKIPVEEDGSQAFLEDRAGREVVSALDAADLRRIAEATGGAYVDAAARTDPLVALYDERILPTARETTEADGRHRREDRFQWALALALVLFGAELSLTDRRRPARAVARPRRARAVAALAVLSLVLLGCDRTSTGAEAWRAGRVREAFDAFDRAVRDAGDDASPELLYDHALASLRVGEPALALASAERAAKRGGPAFEARRDFLRGNVAFARSEAAEAEAKKPGAPPTTAERALADAEDALAAWRAAAASRQDWPEARRNVERALLRLERLRPRKSGADRPPEPGPKVAPETTPEPTSPTEPKPDLPPPPDGRGPDAPPTQPLETQTAELPAGQVLRLLDVLSEKERQKLALRKGRRYAPTSSVERDW